MPYAGTIPENDKKLRKEVKRLIGIGRKQDLVEAREMYDEYIRSGKQVTNGLTLCALATLWRELGDGVRLQDVYEALKPVDGPFAAPPFDTNFRATVSGEMALYNAVERKPDTAQAFVIQMRGLRTDRMRKPADSIVIAKCAMYAKNYIYASLTMIGAAALFEHLPYVDCEQVDNHSWWSFVIGVLAGDKELVSTALSWLKYGRYAQETFVPPTDKPGRVKVIELYQRATSLPIAPDLIGRLVVRAALLYDAHR